MKNRYFKLAKKVAGKRERGKIKRRYRLGAVGIRNDGVIVVSVNLPSRQVNKLAHAEVRLTKKLDKGSVIYVARIHRNGSLAMARPCENCQRTMRLRGVRRCYYSIKESRGSFEY